MVFRGVTKDTKGRKGRKGRKGGGGQIKIGSSRDGSRKFLGGDARILKYKRAPCAAAPRVPPTELSRILPAPPRFNWRKGLIPDSDWSPAVYRTVSSRMKIFIHL
jgi:hypothetical protein